MQACLQPSIHPDVCCKLICQPHVYIIFSSSFITAVNTTGYATEAAAWQHVTTQQVSSLHLLLPLLLSNQLQARFQPEAT